MSTVTQTGADGDDGAANTQDPGLPGMNAEAIAATVGDLSNTATGIGGDGGDGASVRIGNKILGGHGGQGGRGFAEADTDVASPPANGEAQATANGFGGSGGSGRPGFGGGDGVAQATAINTAGDAQATAQGVGGEAGGTLAGSIFGSAGEGIAAAKAQATGDASATATAIGGMGSNSSALGVAGSTGGAVNALASAIGGTSAEAKVVATGGAGGEGQPFTVGGFPARAGDGGAVSLTDRVTASTTQNGVVSLLQEADGGAGGESESFAKPKTGNGGNGGNAFSSLTVHDTTSSSVTGNVKAVGGDGGDGGSTNGFGGTATAVARINGIGEINAVARAIGGQAGGTSKQDGAASASAYAVSTGSQFADRVSAFATAFGTAIRRNVLDAPANAFAEASSNGVQETSANASAQGRSGTATAVVNHTGGAVTVTMTSSTSATARGMFANSFVQGDAAQDLSEGGLDSGFVDAYGSAGIVFDTLTPKLQAVFGKPSTFVLGAAGLGVNQTDWTPGETHTYKSSAEWVVGAAALPKGAALTVGLRDTADIGTGMTKLVFTVAEDGTVVSTYTTSSVAAAESHFADRLLNLGAWHANAGGLLDVTISVSVTVKGGTNDAGGDGFGVNVLAGLVPAKPTFMPPAPAPLHETASWGPAAQHFAADHIDPAVAPARLFAPPGGPMAMTGGAAAIFAHPLTGSSHLAGDGSSGIMTMFGHV